MDEVEVGRSLPSQPLDLELCRHHYVRYDTKADLSEVLVRSNFDQITCQRTAIRTSIGWHCRFAFYSFSFRDARCFLTHANTNERIPYKVRLI